MAPGKDPEVQARTARFDALPRSGPAANASGEADFLGEKEFELARRLIGEYAGINLSAHKRNMVHNRLLKRLRALGMGSFSAYLSVVEAGSTGEREAFVNALTTNLTAFFREPHHFELLRQRAQAHVLAGAAAGKRHAPMRIWSSACSTGEEAWSIAMTLREVACAGDILATDIDTEVLQTASSGVYSLERVSGLEPKSLRDHFLRGAGLNQGWVRVRPELHTMVKFMQLNLQSSVWPAQERFDVIFCRNVVIYFDRESQKKLLARFADLLRPGGLLLVGHAESFPAGHPGFRSCGRTAHERVAG
jgi:chemotaxis protein methyltransferase CheR